MSKSGAEICVVPSAVFVPSACWGVCGMWCLRHLCGAFGGVCACGMLGVCGMWELVG